MEETNATGRCVRCGRSSESVSVEELGEWIVDVGGILICPSCAEQSHEAGDSVA